MPMVVPTCKPAFRLVPFAPRRAGRMVEPDETHHFLWRVDYIHFNPVKHGHAVRVRDCPYSSFRRLGAPRCLSGGFGRRSRR
jgi:hypothetical protein